MSNPTTSFFEALGRRGHEALLGDASGTIRFDLTTERGVDRWLLLIDRGDVRVSRDGGGADCVFRCSRATFDRIVAGQSQIYSAWLRNELRTEGDVRLVRLVQRLLPGSPGARHPRDFARERRRAA
ncbi:SCP-2 sterol transfer family protein [Micromonospora viridifaciens]|uniref:SCP-2 sterol transfer family protein n=1 Tax=Micromonospora viridifaciens TaxID=1881 RepID=A0A1C4YRQ4_MICVI|nr:SCP2 sterol-binding domain-containing protein [Micromonospora viridifaciens]SCF23368.1 SCP-2 sterol transfer family protein [Micromonospora viridifaciens]